jgi:hypothetical protein
MLQTNYLSSIFNKKTLRCENELYIQIRPFSVVLCQETKMENNFETERANMRSLKARGEKCKSRIAQAKLRENV